MFHHEFEHFGRDWERQWRRWAKDWSRSWDRRDRVFGRGDVKYVILDLLKEQPRHGYDIIRELESRFGGMYTPSAGTVYPTLQMLEDMGAVTSQEQDGRKVYTITDAGRRILEERSDRIDGIAGRVRDWMRGESATELRELMHEVGELTALVARDARELLADPAKQRRVREVIARTRQELRSILREDRREETSV